jgi:hypothetical protein
MFVRVQFAGDFYYNDIALYDIPIQNEGESNLHLKHFIQVVLKLKL